MSFGLYFAFVNYRVGKCVDFNHSLMVSEKDRQLTNKKLMTVYDMSCFSSQAPVSAHAEVKEPHLAASTVFCQFTTVVSTVS